MLNIVDQFGTASRIFLTSMWQAGFNHPTLVLEDDGYLPENVFSVYQYFMGEIDQNFNLNQQIRTARPFILTKYRFLVSGKFRPTTTQGKFMRDIICEAKYFMLNPCTYA